MEGPDDEQLAPAAAPQTTPAEKLRKNWVILLMLLLLLLVGGLALWVRSARRAALAEQEPVAAASTNIESEIKTPETAPGPPPPSPSAQMETQRRAEQAAQNAPAPASSDEVAEVFAVDTTGQATRKKQRLVAATAAARQQVEQARLAAADVDTVQTTLRDPATGSYRSQTVVVPRHRAAGSGGSPRPRPARAANNSLPPTDTDGTPFETNPDVLAMLGASSAETRAAYERMTGKRYRDPKQAARQIATRARTSSPAVAVADGFNTVKVGGSSRSLAQGDESQQDQLVADIFYKCVINGDQKVRSGSVVMLRLVEDAVVSGVTFPKNSIFAALASVGTNTVTLAVNRLGPARVKASIFDYNYMPGIMIDPVKKIAKDASQTGYDLQSQTTRELSTAIDRSASAANSVVGVGGRLASTVLSRPRTQTKLRDVLLPDGYPILITTGGNDALGAGR